MPLFPPLLNPPSNLEAALPSLPVIGSSYSDLLSQTRGAGQESATGSYDRTAKPYRASCGCSAANQSFLHHWSLDERLQRAQLDGQMGNAVGRLHSHTNLCFEHWNLSAVDRWRELDEHHPEQHELGRIQ